MSQPDETEDSQDTEDSGDTGLGPMPEPRIEPGEPAPGGVDATWEGPHADPAIPDLSLLANPAIDDMSLPAEMRNGEDTSTQATRDERPMSGEQESPA